MCCDALQLNSEPKFERHVSAVRKVYLSVSFGCACDGARDSARCCTISIMFCCIMLFTLVCRLVHSSVLCRIDWGVALCCVVLYNVGWCGALCGVRCCVVCCLLSWVIMPVIFSCLLCGGFSCITYSLSFLSKSLLPNIFSKYFSFNPASECISHNC